MTSILKSLSFFSVFLLSCSAFATNCMEGKSYVTAQDGLGRKAFFCPDDGSACRILKNGTSARLLTIDYVFGMVNGATILVQGDPMPVAIRGADGSIASCGISPAVPQTGYVKFDGQTGAGTDLPLSCDNR